MENNFEPSLAFTLKEEGGEYSNDPHDPGGPTRYGVTMKTWSEWLGRQIVPGEVAELTPEAVKPLYHAMYWNRFRCPDLPAGLDLLVFDFGVNSGFRAAKILQAIVGTTADGVIGPKTLAAVRAREGTSLISTMSMDIAAWYKTLPTFQYFGKGWLARTERRRIAALALAQGSAP